VNGREPTVVTGIPGIQEHARGLLFANFPDNDPSGDEPETRGKQIGLRYVRRREQLDAIRQRALQLRNVLDDDNANVGRTIRPLGD
jgi:hypothetical protein